MADVPTITELRSLVESNDDVSEVNAKLAEAINQLPVKKRQFIVLQLQNPGKSVAAIRKMMGLKGGTDSNRIYKGIEGKLGPVFEALGITEVDIAQPIIQGLNAMKSVPVKLATFNAGGKITGYKVEVIQTPDFNIRLKTTEMLIKLGNYYPKVEFEGKMKHIHELSDKSTDLLLAREKQQENQIPANYEVVDAVS